MLRHKAFKATLTGNKSLNQVIDSCSTIAVVLENKELDKIKDSSDVQTSEWFKRAAENDYFNHDLKTSKSAWIYHKNKRIFLLTHEGKEDKDDKSLNDSSLKHNKITRDLAVKAIQGLRAKKVDSA